MTREKEHLFFMNIIKYGMFDVNHILMAALDCSILSVCMFEFLSIGIARVKVIIFISSV